MRSLRLKQFRSFIDTGRYDLKPITLLVGANSSGKSSYLRFFPLLRQTAETPTRSPLLWFGRYVDFGDFSNAAFRGPDPRTIGLDIQTTVTTGRGRAKQREDVPLDISVTLAAKSNQTYVSSIAIRSWNDTCRIAISADETVTDFAVNDIDIFPYLGNGNLRPIRDAFFPHLRYTDEDNPHVDRRFMPLNSSLAQLLEPLAHNRTSQAKLLAYSRYLSFQDEASMIKALRGFRLRHYMSPSQDDAEFKKIRALTLAKDIPMILSLAQRSMAAFASGISYLGPFRQDPQRFYRQQELAVGQIEPHGENLAMFFRALTKGQLSELSDFIQEYLGVSVNISGDGNHVSIYIGESNDRKHNLIDMGYGLSQVLPVFAMCWATAYGVRISGYEHPTNVLAIEQPELHLHPRHQARLADMFVSVIQLSRKQRARNPHAESSQIWADDEPSFPLSLIVETHSEALVNRLGELIEAKILQAEDVTVLLFQKDDITGATSVRESTYSDNGTLQNWPLGFFAP